MRAFQQSARSIYGRLANMTPAQLLEILDDNENMDFTILSGVSSEILRRQIKYGKLDKDNIMIKWTFFFNDGNVNSIVHNEEEDQRISEWVDDPVGLLYLPGDKFDMYVNIDQCKAIVREIVHPDAPQNPDQKPQEVQVAA